MMKNIFTVASRFLKLAAISAVGIFIAACQEEEPPFIFLSQESVVAGPAVASYKIEVKSNVNWTAKSNADWARVFGEKGNYKGNFELLLDENNSAGTRNCEVVVEGNGCTAVLSIVQTYGEVALIVPVTDFTLSREAASIDVKYIVSTAEAGIDALSNTDWVTVKSAGNGVVKVDVAENATGAARVGIVKIVATDKKGGATVCETNIHQAATENILDVLVDSLRLDAAGETIRIPIVANTEISAECTSQWCQVNVDRQTLVVTATSNDTGEMRETYLLVTTASNKGETLSKKIFVSQAAVVIPDDELTVPVAELGFEGEGGSIKVPFTTDSQVSVKTSSTWLSASIVDSDVEVTVEENATGKLRTGYVTLTTTDGTVGVITVNQVPVFEDSDELTILVPELRVLSGADSHIIPFASNTLVSARSTKEWCKVSVVDLDVIAMVEENQGDARDAYITLTTKTGVSGIVHIFQNGPSVDDGTETVEALVDLVEFGGDAESIKIPYTANSAVNVRTSSPWLTADLSGNDVEISVEENWTGAVRKGYVTLQTSDLCAAVITVIQESKDPEFSFSNEEVNVGFGSGESYIMVTSTGDWKITNTASQIPSWLSVTPLEGSDGETMVTISFKANKFATERTATLFFQNIEFGMKVNVTVTQAENPSGISNYMHLGKGYDASGNYAEDLFVKNSVLDCEALSKMDCISDLVSTNQTVETIVRGNTLEEYEDNYSAEAGLSGSYKVAGFSGSIKANFSAKSLGSAEHSFATFRHVTKKQILKINENETAATLMDCRSESFVNDIEKLSAESLVAKYGTHVVMGFSVGGVIDYSMAADVTSMGSEIDFGVAIKAGFKKEAVGKIETEDSYNQFNSVKNNSAGFESKLLCRGGESQYTSSGFASDAQAASAYESWLSSLEDPTKWVLVDYEGNQLIPLWEFVEEGKRDAVRTAVNAKLTGTGIVQTSSYKTFEMTMPKFSYYKSETEIYQDIFVIKDMEAKIDDITVKMITTDNYGSMFGENSFVADVDGYREYVFPVVPTTGTYKLSKFKNHVIKITLNDAVYMSTNSNNPNRGTAWIIDRSGKNNPPVSYTLTYDGATSTWTYRDANNVDHSFTEDENGAASVGIQVKSSHIQLSFTISMN